MFVKRKNYNPVQKSSDIAKRTFNYYNLSKKVNSMTPLIRNWTSIIGEELCEVAKIEKLIQGKILVIRVKDSSYSQEVLAQEKRIINAIENHSEGVIVDSIRVVCGDPRKLS